MKDLEELKEEIGKLFDKYIEWQEIRIADGTLHEVGKTRTDSMLIAMKLEVNQDLAELIMLEKQRVK